MYQTYAARPKAKKNDGPAVSPAQGPSLADLQRGAMPTQEQFGTPVNLSSAIQAKMESAFGADFSGIQFEIINDSRNPVIVNDKSIDPGEVALTLTTDSEGKASTAPDALPYGAYILHESATNQSMLNTV